MNALPLRSLSLALLGMVALSLTACGGASEAKAPTAQQAEPEPQSIEEAQDQISRARERLASGSGDVEPRRRPDSAPAADAARPGEPAPPPPAAQTDSGSRPAASKAGRGIEESRCSSPCRALASMRRAVTALCRMAGDTDSRCLDAKRTLADSEGRISPCSC